STTHIIKSDGSVWGWGENMYNQLDDGTFMTQFYPVKSNNLHSITSLAAGSGHVLALRSDGTVWAWGSNMNGQIGDGTGSMKWEPVRVPGLVDIVQIAAGTSHSMALQNDGTVWVWGSNYDGQLGIDGYSEYSPVKLTSLPP